MTPEEITDQAALLFGGNGLSTNEAKRLLTRLLTDVFTLIRAEARAEALQEAHDIAFVKRV